MTREQIGEKLSDLQPFIQYLIDTADDEWAVDVVRTEDGRNCMFGHLVDWCYGKGYTGNVNTAWDYFEARWMTTYVIYDVNDGKHPDYQQPSPKRRVVAYLTNLWLGQEVDTETGMALEAAWSSRV
ncbi:hypothetical protein [Mycolicibacterium sp. PDY-3]|uniref:hypothetical protein n=1 Tax=Mycolicibacterium sp. PDY-3 TaxID=3376069 RepID=UPI00378C7B96